MSLTAERHEVPQSLTYLLLLCVLLYAALRNQSWGLPEGWPSDEISWVIDGMLARDSTNPNYFMYPSLAIYLAYIPSRIVLWLVGDVDQATRQYLLGTVCRSVSALAFLGTCITIERLCAQLFGLRTALFALAATGLNGALVHHAHLGTVNSVFFLTIALTLYCLVRVVRTGRVRDVYLAAAVAGLAVGAKYNALFLCAGVPIAYVLGHRPFRFLPFSGRMMLAGLISIGVFILTTPYILLDSPKFASDFATLLGIEGPYFKTPLPFDEYLLKLWADCLGFFTPPGLYVFATIAIAGIAFCTAASGDHWRNASRTTPPWPTDIWRIQLLLCSVLGLFLLMNYSVGIFQSRYTIPGVVTFICIGLIGWYTLAVAARPWPGVFGVARALLAGALLFCFGLSAYVHVEAFSHSAKGIAGTEIQRLLAANPTARVGVVAYPGRSPFALEVAAGRVDVFTSMVAEYDVDSWDAYLRVIAEYFRDRSPQHVALEDIILAWTIFLPKRYADDYSMRLAYPNPGPAAWDQMFASIGYARKQVIAGRLFSPWIYEIVGNWHQVTTEGVGTNKIILYGRDR